MAASKAGYAPPEDQRSQQQQQPYQQPGGNMYKEQQDYEILEAGLVPNINSGGGVGGSAAELEKQLRLGE